MPVTLTSVGDTLVVSLIDSNMESLQDLMRCKLVASDFVGKFTRYQILRYTGGRIVSVNTFANQLLLKEMSTTQGQLDLTYRYGSDDSYQPIDSTAAAWSGLAMEYLGRPGPSLYYQWQEDGYTSADVNGYDTSGTWPPAYWPINRYPDDVCFSFWLTVPGASQKIWVNEPCVARIRATAKGDLNFHQNGVLSQSTVSIPTVGQHFYYGSQDQTPNTRELNMSRFALFVDRNPDIGTEFTNTNPNVLNRDGSQASYVSWKKIREKCFYTPQRALIKMVAEVALQGDAFYNFSMKYRDGGVKGGIIDGQWDSGHWRPINGSVLGPTANAAWLASYALQCYDVNVGLLGSAGATSADVTNPDLVGLWESSGLTVEFFYGRTTAYRTDSSNSEF